jgi:electron transfer flavoprotein beta subunit
MRIIVLIKPATELEESDACAVEHALGLARRRLDVQVSLLTAGTSSCVRALRTALALGADDAVHVADVRTSPHDVLALSRVLAETIRELGFDLVLCGADAQTPNLSVLPAMIAVRLGIPALCHATHLDLDSVTTPTLISVTSCSAPLAYPSFPSIAEARQKLISSRASSACAPTHPAVTVKAQHPRPNTIIKAEEDPHEAVARLVDFLADHRFI